MIKKRLVAVVVVRDGRVVQSEKFRHTNVIHSDAIHAVEAFSRWDVDEIVLLNVSREKDPSRDQFLRIVERVSEVCFVPLTVGGFVDDEAYAEALVAFGADKLIVNTAFEERTELTRAIAFRFGKQCLVASIDIRLDESLTPVVYVDRGMKSTGKTLSQWIDHCAINGAGEIFLNNIEFDGNRKGYDLTSLRSAVNKSSLPIIIFGGAFHNKHFAEGLEAGASAVAAANIFHYKEMATKSVKRFLKRSGYNVRNQ